MATDDPMGRSELHYAACDNDIINRRGLVPGNPEINLQDKNGWTPLHFAAQSRSFEIAKLLIEAGARVDVQDKNGNTPLNRAVFNYRERADAALIKLLRERGADPYKANNYGQTPLGLARLVANYDVAHCFDDLLLDEAKRLVD